MWRWAERNGALTPDDRHGFRAFGAASMLAFPPGDVFGERWIAIGSQTMFGPNVSLSASCVVSSSTVEDTIAMEGSRIEGVATLTGSILGRNVEVRHSGSVGVTRLVVGDQSRVEV